jgi:ABC-2 type transport system ATP-binding protein
MHIVAHHLNKAFGDNLAVNDLNLQVAEGDVYGLVGPDGAGKTSTLRLLCGAFQPTHMEVVGKSEIRICEFDISSQTEQARSRIGYLAQRFSLYEELTVLENLRFFAEIRGLAAREWRPRCMDILNFVGLDQFIDRRAGNLSGGMRQKLGLAAALVHQPQVLLLDEPTTGVDPVTRQDFWQLIIRLAANSDQKKGGVAVIVSTPYMDEAARCSRVGFMRRGRMIVEGTPRALLEKLGRRIFELRGSDMSALRQIAEDYQDILSVQMFGDRMHLRVKTDKIETLQDELSEYISGRLGEDFRLRQIPGGLEDVFHALVEGDESIL